MRLLKFFPYNQYLLEGLTNQTLFFSNIYNFNDPFEGVFRYKVSSDYNKFKEFYLNHYNGPRRKLDYYFENKIEFEKLINKSFDWRYNNNAVCCFSDKSKLKDILMWANYADKHKGVCLVFDKAKLSFTQKESIINGTYIGDPNGPHMVAYTDKYLDLDPLSKKLNQDSFLTTKFKKWSAEKEYRFISPRAGNCCFNPNSLLEVIFGLRISPDSKETIKKIVNVGYVNVRFRKINLLSDKFGFTLVKE
ncbi:MAG: DUF2971 domain-containing protein [Ignavibacteriaceae bacterium]|jgi:hypothetical protein